MRVLFLLFILLLPATALSQDNPTSYIRANIDKVLSILASPEYESETNKTEQLRQIEAVVDNFSTRKSFPSVPLDNIGEFSLPSSNKNSNPCS